jgi:hypothetical protein
MDPSINPLILSGLASYDLGSLSVRYAYELHLDYFGLSQLGGAASPGASFENPHSNDDAHEIVAWYTVTWWSSLPISTRVAGIVERLTYRTDETVSGQVSRYQRDAIYGAVQQRLGAHQVWGSFGQAGAGSCTRVGGASCTTNGLAGRQWSVGYTYSPAKTVDIYAAYYEMNNGRSASYGLYPPVAPVSPGVTTRAFGVGILYLFDVSVGFGGPKQPPEPPGAPAEPPEPPAAEPPAEPPAPAPPAPGPA